MFIQGFSIIIDPLGLEKGKFGGDKTEGTDKTVNEVTNLLDKMPEFTGSTREKLLSAVQNGDFRKIVNELYRPGAIVGDGGTASILRKEFYEGLQRIYKKRRTG